MENAWLLALSVTVAALVVALLGRRSADRHLPPGPRPLPLIGNLHQLGASRPWIALARLAAAYGDVLFVRMGTLPAVVLSSPAAVKDFHLDHGRFFLSRPDLYLFRTVGRGNAAGIISVNGDIWKKARKLSLQLMMTKSKVAHYESATSEIAAAWLNEELPRVFADTKSHLVSGLHDRLHLLFASVMMRICVGTGFNSTSDAAFVRLVGAVDEFMVLGTEGYLGDYFPLLNYFPSGYRSRARAVSNVGRDVVGEFVSKALAGRAAGVGHEPCILTQLLDVADTEGITEDFIAPFLFELIGGGTDTSGTLLEWVLVALANFPEVQERLRHEVRSALGDRVYTGEDAASLPYLSAVVFETLRFVVLDPIPVPRVATDDVHIRGFRVPKGTVVFTNLYAMFRDPSLWPQPDVFRPDRFLEKDYDVLSCHNPDFPAFSVGARQCPGARLSAMTMSMVLTMILQRYRIGRPTDALISFETTAALVAAPKQPVSLLFEPLA